MSYDPMADPTLDAFVEETRNFNQLVEAFAIDGVPSLGVAGKYYLDGQTARGLTRGIQIATALAAQEARR